MDLLPNRCQPTYINAVELTKGAAATSGGDMGHVLTLGGTYSLSHRPVETSAAPRHLAG